MTTKGQIATGKGMAARTGVGFERTNTGHCLGVAAHPLGSIAASSSLDSFVRVFDVDSNATLATLEAPPSEEVVVGGGFEGKSSMVMVREDVVAALNGIVEVAARLRVLGEEGERAECLWIMAGC